MLLFVATSGKAQEKENFYLFSDRALYSSGETILIKVIAPKEEQSGVVHVNLIDLKGKIITEISKKLTSLEANGSIYISDSLKTGTYLICASTLTSKSMTTKELFICNRFSGSTESNSFQHPADSKQLIPTNVNIEFDSLKSTYKTRNKVHVTLHIPTDLSSQIEGNLLISAAQDNPGFSAHTSTVAGHAPASSLVEKEGVLLSGIVRDAATLLPFKNGYVFLSLPDSIPRLHYCISGEDGRFNFLLDNYSGKLPVVVQAVDVKKKSLLKIEADRHDSLTNFHLPVDNVALPDSFQKSMNDGNDAATLGKIFNYNELKEVVTTVDKQIDYPFYGVPTEVVFPKLFIDLPDFTEISRELLPGVKFRAYNRIPTMQILNPSTQNYFSDQPLILLDNIPIQDLNVIKNLGSKEIEKVEICRKERFYGDLSFPGVVAITTTRKDLSLVPTSGDLIKQIVNALQPDAEFNIPNNLTSNEPDLRKVLYWNPKIKPEKSIQIDFETSDLRGNYKLVVSGKTRDGAIIYKEQLFEVN